MDAASFYTIHVSDDEDLHPHAYHRAPSTTPSLSPTLVNSAHDTERPSLKLRFLSGASNILNSLVVDLAGQSLYSISSNSKRTILVSCSDSDNVEIARVWWDRSSPRMVFRGKKWKCKYWLPRTAPDNESRILTHGDSQFTWMQETASGHLIAANQPGVAVAQWHTSHSNELILEIFQEPAVESSLLEAIVLSVVLLRSGRSLGDSLERVDLSNPMYLATIGVGVIGLVH